jgi:hypothetical protein
MFVAGSVFVYEGFSKKPVSWSGPVFSEGKIPKGNQIAKLGFSSLTKSYSFPDSGDLERIDVSLIYSYWRLEGLLTFKIPYVGLVVGFCEVPDNNYGLLRLFTEQVDLLPLMKCSRNGVSYL